MMDFLKKPTVANKDVLGTVGLVTSLWVCFHQTQMLSDFLMIGNPHFEVIIGLPKLETLQNCFELRTQTVTMKYTHDEVKLSLDHDPCHSLRTKVEIDSKKFITESDLETPSNVSDLTAYLNGVVSDSDSKRDFRFGDIDRRTLESIVGVMDLASNENPE